ncbi:unnamed protein product [Pleuronectes platessa]|uniref:Uncharacterized protein n=1 Tax=Pleuronectes platessa TaxID=8262 RepID=A0A9N7Z202_PLEPL|nr:unnamed protein product [Pleuronectes platessa]
MLLCVLARLLVDTFDSSRGKHKKSTDRSHTSPSTQISPVRRTDGRNGRCPKADGTRTKLTKILSSDDVQDGGSHIQDVLASFLYKGRKWRPLVLQSTGKTVNQTLRGDRAEPSLHRRRLHLSSFVTGERSCRSFQRGLAHPVCLSPGGFVCVAALYGTEEMEIGALVETRRVRVRHSVRQQI